MTQPGGQRAASPLDACPEAVITTDSAGCITRWNPAATELLGPLASAVLGLPLTSVVELTPRDETGRFPERQWAVCGQLRVPVENTTWTTSEEDEPRTHLLLRDSTSRVEVESDSDRAAAVLRRQARFDALTGLANGTSSRSSSRGRWTLPEMPVVWR